MSKQRLTGWFDPDVKPAIPGVYEVKSRYGSPGPWYSYFDGKKFCYRDKGGPQAAAKNSWLETVAPESATWRGLAEDPSL